MIVRRMFVYESTYPYTPFAYMYTPLCLHVQLRITQLHTKFSRQFKGLHMILSNLFMTFPTALNSVNLA